MEFLKTRTYAIQVVLPPKSAILGDFKKKRLGKVPHQWGIWGADA
jgi:hypothetical protein